MAFLELLSRRALAVKALLLVLSAPVLASITLVHGHGPRFSTGGSDGAGGIPYAGLPHPASGVAVPYELTIGLVIDAQSSVVVGTPIVITCDCGALIAAGITDDRGTFQFELPSISGLKLSLPLEGVFDVPIEAGEPVLVVLP